MDMEVQTAAKRQVVDLTAAINTHLKRWGRSATGCAVFVHHTTAAVTTADLDPGTDLDMLDAFAALIPKLSYRHPHDPAHVPDHILASLIGPSVTVPLAEGQLDLGQWQRVVLVECDGPRSRRVTLTPLSS